MGMGYPEGAQPDRTAQGIVIILASVLIMAFADAVVKLVSGDLTLWQIFVARSLVTIPIMIVLSRAMCIGLKPRAPIWALLRSGLLWSSLGSLSTPRYPCSACPWRRSPSIPIRS